MCFCLAKFRQNTETNYGDKSSKIKLILTSSEVKTRLETEYYIPSAILRQNTETNYGVKSFKKKKIKLILTSLEINTYLETDYYIPSAMIG